MGTDLPISLEDRKAEGKPLVLIVDDDPTHHRLMQVIAKRLEFTAHITSSCGQALEALKILAFDVILMDYRMPEIDGCSCTKMIRSMKEIQQIPIIAVTAHVISGSREECLQAGMDDFLSKPFTLEAFHKKVKFWLQKKRE